MAVTLDGSRTTAAKTGRGVKHGRPRQDILCLAPARRPAHSEASAPAEPRRQGKDVIVRNIVPSDREPPAFPPYEEIAGPVGG